MNYGPPRPRRASLFHAALLWLALAALSTAAICAVSSAAAPEAHQRLTILHFNDLHGYLQEHKDADGKMVGGIARMAALIKQIREQNDAVGVPTLVLHAGDMLTGSVLSATYRGLADVRVLNYMKLDATAVGNHDFDFGRDAFDKLTTQAKFPWLACNLREKRGLSPWLPISWYRRFPSGLSIGLVGVTTDKLTTETAPKNVRDLVVDDPVPAIRTGLARTGGKDSIHILLSHCGLEADRAIVRKIPVIDIVVGGHNHLVLEQPLVENGHIFVQAGKYGEHLGRLDVERDHGELKIVRYKMYAITPDLPSDPVVKAMVDGYVGDLNEKVKEKIGDAAVKLDGAPETIRRGESNLGDFVCDAVRARVGVDVALINGGSFRAALPPGPITVADIMEMLPFDDTIHKMTVPGRTIRAALEHANAGNPDDNPGAFMQVAGLTYEIDGRRATNIRVAGEPLDDDKNYMLATNDFLAAGGDQFDMLKGQASDVDTGIVLRDLIVETIRRQKTINAPLDGRIKRLGGAPNPRSSSRYFNNSATAASMVGLMPSAKTRKIGSTTAAISSLRSASFIAAVASSVC